MSCSVYIGELVGTHGVLGDLKLGKALRWFDGTQDFTFLSVGKTKEQADSKTVVLQRWHKNRYLLRFSDIDSLEKAKEIVGMKVFSDNLPELADDEYFVSDLVGLSVFDENQKIVGTVEAVYFVAARSMLAIRDLDKKEILIPMNDEFVEKILLDMGEIHCKNIRGLQECA